VAADLFHADTLTDGRTKERTGIRMLIVSFLNYLLDLNKI